MLVTHDSTVFERTAAPISANPSSLPGIHFLIKRNLYIFGYYVTKQHFNSGAADDE